jgi:hypothetical protein
MDGPSLRSAKRRACALKRYGAQAWQSGAAVPILKRIDFSLWSK